MRDCEGGVHEGGGVREGCARRVCIGVCIGACKGRVRWVRGGVMCIG